MTVTTPRLRLHSFTAADFAWLHPIAASPAVTRYTDWGPNTPEDTQAFLAEASQSGSGPDQFTWAVTLPEGTGIGSAGLEVTSRSNRRASLGYMLDSGHWGQGYATEVAVALLEFAQTLGMHRVEATCHPDNAGSVRVLEKAGLTLEGRLRDHLLVRGAWRDSQLFAVIVWAPRPTSLGEQPEPRRSPAGTRVGGASRGMKRRWRDTLALLLRAVLLAERALIGTHRSAPRPPSTLLQ